MGGRFRYVRPDGAEVEAETTDAVVRAYMAGEIQPETLLFDAQGGGWSPARSHTALLAVGLPGISFTLAEDAPETSEDVVRELVREREVSDSEALPPGLAALNEHEEPASSAPPQTQPAAEPPMPAPPPPPVPERIRPAAPRPAVWRPLLRSRRTVALLGALTTGLASVAAVLFLFVLLGDRTPAAVRAAGIPAELPVATPVAAVVESFVAIEAGALRDLVAEAERLQSESGLDDAPRAWLEGAYLAGAGSYPDVEAYWTRYAAMIESVRSSEGEWFHAALRARLQSQGLSGAESSMRLARGIRNFEADRARRDAVYGALADLSGAALALHAFLVTNEERITHEPAAGGISREPVTEAVAEDETLALEMNRRLDDVFAALERVNGSRVAPRRELPAALRRGLLGPGAIAMR